MTKKRISPLLEWPILLLVIVASGLLLTFGSSHFYRAAYPTDYQEIVVAESSRNQLPPSLVYAIIRTESGFNPLAQSSIPARGLMQITQETFEWAHLRGGEGQPVSYEELFQGDVNIRYGTAIFRLLLDEFGTESNALCAYHAGWGRAKQWLADPAVSPDGQHIEHIPYGDTRGYVAKVLATQETYQTLYHIP